MDIKDGGGAQQKVARKNLLDFYDVLATHDDFSQVTEEDFCVLEDEGNNVRRRRKKKKKKNKQTDQASMKDKVQSLGPPPKKLTSPSSAAG